jgi:hypothetical protein
MSGEFWQKTIGIRLDNFTPLTPVCSVAHNYHSAHPFISRALGKLRNINNKKRKASLFFYLWNF